MMLNGKDYKPSPAGWLAIIILVAVIAVIVLS